MNRGFLWSGGFPGSEPPGGGIRSDGGRGPAVVTPRREVVLLLLSFLPVEFFLVFSLIFFITKEKPDTETWRREVN